MAGGENKSGLMRPRTTSHVYSLIQRISVAEFGHVVAVPAGAVGASFFSTAGFVLVPLLAKNQALRIVSGFVAAGDNGATGKLQLESLGFGVFVSPTQALRRAFLAPIAKSILGLAGANFGFSDDEFILGQDYSEIGMAGGAPVIVNCHGVVTNLDGALAHNMATSFAVLAELYDVSG